LALLLVAASGAASAAESLSRPPASIVGVGNAPCSDFVATYGAMEKIKRHEDVDPATLAKTYEDYGNFTGTLGGFFASAMMEHGDRKWPFKSMDYAMSLIYEACQHNPSSRYIDIVHVMSKASFPRGVRWK
ncbi:MAG: hypothetical protein PHU14_06695, partial [Methylovulum sp.]|nr:hypothetical protein [Methylovulum sp.]